MDPKVETASTAIFNSEESTGDFQSAMKELLGEPVSEAEGEKKEEGEKVEAATGEGEKAEEKKEESGAAEGTKEAEEQAPPTPIIPDEMRELFPEVKNLGELAPRLKDLASELGELRKSDETISKIFDDHPAAVKLFKLLSKGEAFPLAVRKALELESDEEIPDPSKDPKGYETFLRKQVEREQAAKNEEAEGKKRQEHAKKVEEATRKQLTAFYEANKVSEADQKAFQMFMREMFYGDEVTGMPARNMAEVMFKAFRYENDVKAARKAGQVEGKNAKIEETVTKDKLRAGDGLPNLRGGGGPKEPTDALSDIERSIVGNRPIFA